MLLLYQSATLNDEVNVALCIEEELRKVMSTQVVEIRILGRLMRVNCPTGQESALIEAAADFDKRLHELSERTNVTNPEQLLTIAALNQLYEFKAEKQKLLDGRLELEYRLSELDKTVENALLQYNESKSRKPFFPV